jgi:signal peptidase II
MKSSQRWAPALLIVSAVLLLDQISKAWVLGRLALYESLPLLPPVLFVTYSQNTGAAFGMFAQAGDLLLLVAVVVVVGLLVYYGRTAPEALWTRVGIALVCGGALGNVIDRLQHGFVVDFVHVVIPNVLSNVSNFADHSIAIGVVVWFYDTWRTDQRAAADAQAAADTGSVADAQAAADADTQKRP